MKFRTYIWKIILKFHLHIPVYYHNFLQKRTLWNTNNICIAEIDFKYKPNYVSTISFLLP